MSSEKLKKHKKELIQLSKKRQKLIEIFLEEESLIAGSYMKTRVRCGSAKCHCQRDGGHLTMRISHWDGGKLKSKIVRIEDREWVAKASANYKVHKQALREIEKINTRVKEVLKLIMDQKARIYE